MSATAELNAYNFYK